MDDVTALRDALVLQYNATAEPSEYGAQEFEADLDALIAAAEARGAAQGLTVEALAKALHECGVDCSRFRGTVMVSPSGASPLDRVVLSCSPAYHVHTAEHILAALSRPEGSRVERSAIPGGPMQRRGSCDRCGQWQGASHLPGCVAIGIVTTPEAR